MTELKKDLFDFVKENKNLIIMHCISSDLAMGAGIAKPLQDTFHIRENWPKKLPDRLKGWRGSGYAVLTPTNEENIFICNLVTKQNYYNKPTYESLEESLWCAATDMQAISQLHSSFPYKIVMPRIGCGLDKLEWEKVQLLIRKILHDFDVTVCFL